jgi:3-oxoacyl-[acyl-carrier protein] reductase
VLIQHGKDAEKPEATVEQMRKAGARAGTVSADLADPDGPHKLAKQARGIIGDRLDILVASMGTAKGATFEDTTIADFDRMFAANVPAPFFRAQQFLPLMCKGSCIYSSRPLRCRLHRTCCRSMRLRRVQSKPSPGISLRC